MDLSSTCLDIYLVNQLICQNNWKITVKFCGLLRKAELYQYQAKVLVGPGSTVLKFSFSEKATKI